MLRLYWRVIFRPFCGSILVMAGLSAVAATMGVASVGLVIPIVGALIASDGASGDMSSLFAARILRHLGFTQGNDTVLVVLLLAVCLALVVRGLLLVLNQWVTYTMAIRAWHAVYQQMFRAFLSMRFSELTQRSKGSMLQDIQVPATAISEVISSTSKGLVAITELLLLSWFIVRLAWWAALLCLLLGGLGVYAMRRAILRRAEQYNRQSYTLLQHATALMTDALDGIRVVKVSNVAERLLRQLAGLLAAQRRLGIRYGVVAEIPGAFLEFVVAIPVIAVVALALWHPLFSLHPSTLAGLAVAISRIRSPAQACAQSAVLLVANLRKAEIIDETLARLPRETTLGVPQCLPEKIDAIELDDVTFGYPGRASSEPVLNGVSLRFSRGEVTAIVGSTGAGKTTIADLLVRLYDPQRGSIRVAGVELRRTDVVAWRARVGYVGQDPFLFNTTLSDNLTLWNQEIAEDRLRWAVRAAQLDDVIAGLPEGYQTIVGDRGLRLSGGQRQRVAIARAILHRPEVLIFDEATSALDNVTERAVHLAIQELKRDAIILLIAHRLSTVRDADRIVVLQQGRVVERGLHDQLLAAQGVYWRLYHSDQRLPMQAGAIPAPIERWSTAT